jgi:hypothetical protein
MSTYDLYILTNIAIAAAICLTAIMIFLAIKALILIRQCDKWQKDYWKVQTGCQALNLPVLVTAWYQAPEPNEQAAMSNERLLCLTIAHCSLLIANSGAIFWKKGLFCPQI